MVDIDINANKPDFSFSSHTDISVLVAIQEVKKAYEIRSLIRFEV
jgi:hypothetical protein